jgi:XisI protein
MDKLKIYQQLIVNTLEAYIASDNLNQEEELYLVKDDTKMHYLLYNNWWRERDCTRFYGCLVHVRIKNEKIYIEYDGTDEGFGDVFVEKGVPKKDIVLAFHAPSKRPYTGFGVE